jgi:hypothetical protein
VRRDGDARETRVRVGEVRVWSSRMVHETTVIELDDDHARIMRIGIAVAFDERLVVDV